MRIFLAQNDNDYENFKNLYDPLVDYIFDLSEVAGDTIRNVDINLANCVKLKLPKQNKFGIYQTQGFSRAKLLWRIDLNDIFSLSNEITELIMGCDGALQRKIIAKVRDIYPDCRTTVWSDGLLGPHEESLKWHVLRLIEPLASRYGFSWLLPSEICGSSLVDKVFVLTDSCRSALLCNRVAPSKVEVKSFPRFNNQESDVKIKTDSRRILYVVSAFEWHGRSDIEAWEVDVVNKISNLTQKENINIRVHPRSGITLRKAVQESGLRSSINNVTDDILASATIISFASSCLFEAALAGKNALVYEKGAPYIKRAKFIESLKKVSNIKDMNELF